MPAPVLDRAAAQRRILAWFDAHERPLPWRSPDTTPWGTLVSEVMLQQTPVRRVLPAYEAWMKRWPTPADLAGDDPGEAVRQWGRLGYPRRALRLHEVATAITEQYAGRVPDDLDALRALPGIGEYTAAAVATMAYGHRHVVADVNVRRVVARLDTGLAHPPGHLTNTERARLQAWLPDDPATARRWSAGVMELGALVCTSTTPACESCPVAYACAWRAAGFPAATQPRKSQAWHGTDRQCRGMILQRLRDADTALTPDELAAIWPDRERAIGCLEQLVSERLVHVVEGGYALNASR